MNIDPLRNESHYISSSRRHAAFNEEATRLSRPDIDQVHTDRSAGLREALAAQPEIRPEVVARGRELLANPNYPGPDVVAKIASLITPLPED